MARRKRAQSVSKLGSIAAKKARMLAGFEVKKLFRSLPERADRACAGQVDPSEMPIHAIAEIDDVIVAPAQIAEQGGAHRKTVGVDLDLIAPRG